MTPAAHEAVPARGFNLEEEPVLCAPVQRSCWLRHPFLPKLIRKLLETPAIRKAAAHIVGNRDSRIELSRHHESESEKICRIQRPVVRAQQSAAQGNAGMRTPDRGSD